MQGGKFVAYYRVSTARQGQSGLGLEAQKKAVADYLNGGDWELAAEFVEVESGKLSQRPELERAMEACRQEKATLIIAKLDRLSRNVHFISGLMESGVEFLAVDFPQANRFTLHIMAAVAEHEREMISKRTKAALQAAKAKGRKLGWSIPERRAEQLDASKKGARINRASADYYAAQLRPIIEDIQNAGVSTLSGIAEALNARGVRTARGGQWYATTVRNLLARA